MKGIVIIDFDSTLIQTEGLDELTRSIANKTNNLDLLPTIEKITQAGMNGDISFAESLAQRMSKITVTKQDIDTIQNQLLHQITPSISRNIAFFKQHANQIYIVSGGFRDYILPVAEMLGIPEQHIFANEFIWDNTNTCIGYEQQHVMAQDGGKIQIVQSLVKENEPVYVIGDGFTDYQIKLAGLCDKFYLFQENVQRPQLQALADHCIHSFDEFLYDLKQQRSQYFPKTQIKVLLLENIHPKAVSIFQSEQLQIEEIKGALDEEELIEKISDIHILCIRSKTQVTPSVLHAAKKLLAIGTFCIGTNQVDIQTAAAKGIVVFNAPFSNTRSVVELTIGSMIMLMRNTFTKSNQMHQGIWDKSATNSYEIRGKTLGIIGYGNIGSQLSVLAESMGMRVVFYDVADKLSLGNAQACTSLQSLLEQADIVSLHVDGREQNTHFIGANEFTQMKDKCIFINYSRGHVVDVQALQHAVQIGKIAGCAIDVYPDEPKTNQDEFISSLRHLPNTILTPHIGGSTEEAQANIGEYVPHKLLNYVNKGDTYGAVNFPELQLPPFKGSHRLLHIHQNIPGILAKINAVFATHEVNIQSQYLKTTDNIGYVITDVETDYNDSIIEAIRNIEGTIKFRILY